MHSDLITYTPRQASATSARPCWALLVHSERSISGYNTTVHVQNNLTLCLLVAKPTFLVQRLRDFTGPDREHTEIRTVLAHKSFMI